MKRWLQRLRGVVGTALTWAAGWSVAGMLIGTTGLFGNLALIEYAIFGGVFAVLGFIGGAAFSVVLSVTEGRRRFDQMSLPRFAVWGAAGGALLELAMTALGQAGGGLATWGFFMLLGSGSAAGSLVLARRAEHKELLESGEDIAEAELSRDETRRIVGD